MAGTAQGPRLKATLTAIDYLHVRADGRFELHIHGEMTTEDGARIALYADGVALPEPGGARAQLRENVTLRTSFPACKWVNGLQPWAQGVVNLQTGEVTFSAFTM